MTSSIVSADDRQQRKANSHHPHHNNNTHLSSDNHDDGDEHPFLARVDPRSTNIIHNSHNKNGNDGPDGLNNNNNNNNISEDVQMKNNVNNDVEMTSVSSSSHNNNNNSSPPPSNYYFQKQEVPTHCAVSPSSTAADLFEDDFGGGKGNPETAAALARLERNGNLPTHVAPTTVRNVKEFFLYEPCVTGGELSWWMLPLKNRWFRSVFQLIPVFLVGSIVFAWQHYSGLLYASQAYLNLCTDEEIADYWAQGAIDQDVLYQPACRRQEVALGRIYIVNSAGEQVCGAIAGIIIDSWGPFSSALIGVVAIVFSFIFLLSATPANSILYVFGSIFIGSGVNFIVYPAVVLGDVFPYHAPFMSALAIAIQVAGAFVTSALDLIHRHSSLDLRRILALLFFIFVLPSLVFSTLSTPVKRISILRRDQAVLDREHARRDAVRANDTETLRAMAEEDRLAREAFNKRRPFMADLVSWNMALVAGICLIGVIVYNYYPVILRDISGDAVARVNGYLLPTSAIWGTLYGLAADYWGTVDCAAVLMLVVIVVYALVLTHAVAMHYLATVFHTLGSACIFSVKFSYVVEMYQPQNQGRLLSSLAVVSGAALLLNILVASFEDTRGCCIAMLVLSFPVLVMLFVLRRRTRGQRLVDLMKKEKEAVEQQQQPLTATATAREPNDHRAHVDDNSDGDDAHEQQQQQQQQQQ